MKILVLNAGSSSLKYKLFEKDGLTVLSQGMIDCIGPDFSMCKLDVINQDSHINRNIAVKNHREAVEHIIKLLLESEIIDDHRDINLIGHRVVHGGEYYKEAVTIDDTVVGRIEELSELAPMHNPPNREGIEACQSLFKDTPQIAVFDTAFHQTIPQEAFLYGLPMHLYEQYKIRKYGFHGISHQYIAKEASKKLDKTTGKIISCHLGNGSSVTAIENGKSVDTSMGFTPLDGLIMGTRSGDIDSEIIFYLMRKKKMSATELEDMLTKRSGLFGITEISSDVRELYTASKRGDKDAILGIDMLSYRIAKRIGSYLPVLNGVDAIVFTAGIGENAFYIRKSVCDKLAFLGIKLDAEKNKNNDEEISAPDSSVKVYVLPTNEELEIATQAIQLT